MMYQGSKKDVLRTFYIWRGASSLGLKTQGTPSHALFGEMISWEYLELLTKNVSSVYLKLSAVRYE